MRAFILIFMGILSVFSTRAAVSAEPLAYVKVAGNGHVELVIINSSGGGVSIYKPALRVAYMLRLIKVSPSGLLTEIAKLPAKPLLTPQIGELTVLSPNSSMALDLGSINDSFEDEEALDGDYIIILNYSGNIANLRTGVSFNAKVLAAISTINGTRSYRVLGAASEVEVH